MSLSLGMSQTLGLKQLLKLSLKQSFGDTSGDIPVYSLHKIVRLLKAKPIQLSPQLCTILNRAIIAANREYKAESGNDWNCLTSNNLVEMIESVESEVKEINEDAVSSLPRELAGQAAVCERFFTEKRSECIAAIKEWFKANYDGILYDMDGKVPWAIVQRLRRNLGLWIAGATNPFAQDIEEMICEVAREKDIDTDDAEEAWKAMGGELFEEED